MTNHIIIDPGHGVNSRPVYPDGACETAIVWDVALILAGLLVEDEFEVTLTKSSRDEKPTLAARRKIKGDVFVSLHCNAASSSEARGASCIYADKIGKKLGETISQELSDYTGFNLRGVRGAHLWYRAPIVPGVLKHNKAKAAVIVECGFLTNDDDRKFLNSKEGKLGYAMGVFWGICEFLREG